MVKLMLLLLLMVAATTALAEQRRDGKYFSVFQVVRFPNDPCVSSDTNRNGTCYSAEECESRGGTGSGMCAQGYGVCCVVTLSCGGSSSENNTFLVQTAVTMPIDNNDPCIYTICRTNSDICRIRLDFDSLTLAPPVEGTTDQAAAPETNGGAVGDCATDTLSISSPGSTSPPVICGVNTGQHMILDVTDTCSMVAFDIGAGMAITREWTIRVTQYACMDLNAGPRGCLQYHTGATGTVSSFNFPSGTVVGTAATHLSNQNYKICIRREANNCAICYTVAISVAAPTPAIQTSFGISKSGAAAAQSVVGACPDDFLQIPNPLDQANAKLAAGGMPKNDNGLNCGRFLNVATGMAAPSEVCSAVKPFTLDFFTDGDEASIMPDMADMNEQALAPGGIIGFSLNYKQITC